MATNDAPPAEPETTEEQSPEDFQAELRARAADQGGGEVPEQRPIASQQVATEVGTVQARINESGENVHGVDDSAMDKAAYERADSDAQAKKAAKQSREVTRLEIGTKVRFNEDAGVNEGRVGAITRIVSWASPEDAMQNQLGTPESRFAEVAEYEVVTRDSRKEPLVVGPDQFKVIPDSEYVNVGVA